MIALDTNVLIYACDKADPARQQIALDLISSDPDAVILWQVACEFIAASRKLAPQGFTAADAWERLGDFLAICPLMVPTGAAILDRAKKLHLTQNVSFWGRHDPRGMRRREHRSALFRRHPRTGHRWYPCRKSVPVGAERVQIAPWLFEAASSPDAPR